MPVPHEITLICFVRDAETGLLSIADLVETSRHFAPRFARNFRTYSGFAGLAAISPGAPLNVARFRELSARRPANVAF